MKVLSKETKEVITAKVRALEGMKCDVCGRIILPKQGRQAENKYYEVATGHFDWGNDSFESRENYDICPICVNNFISDYLAKGKGSEYIEVNTEYCHPTDVRE